MQKNIFPPRSNAIKPKTILAVEDERSIRMIYERELTRAGHAVRTACDGLEGLRKFAEGGVSLVISGYEMPGMNGLALLKEIRKLSPDARVIIATGGRNSAEIQELREAGAFMIMEMPFDMAKLRDAVSRGLADGFSEFKAEPEPVIQKKTRILFVDDEQIMLYATGEMCLTLGFDMEGASCAEKALEIFRERGADVVVSDFRMPGKNGIELMNELRSLNPEIKFILATADIRLSVHEEALSRGAMAVLSKPYSIEEFEAAILGAINGKKQ